MTGTALVFPGQGAQKVGMGADVAARWPDAVGPVYARAAEVLGYDLLALCREGPAEALVRTDVQQPAILAAGIACYEAMLASGALRVEEVSVAFGLSLGEFTALQAAGALELGDALVLVRERGLGMQAASEAHPSGLTALRCDAPDAEALCAAARELTGGTCTVANLNAPGQVVISGDLASLDAAEAIAAERGIRRPARLPVAGAFHSPLMQIGADRLARALENIEIRTPRVPVISNVTGKPTTDPDEIRANLIAQVTSPVLFVDCVESALALGVTRVVESAPGRVLTGLARRIDAAGRITTLVNADTAEAIEAWAAAGETSA
ncbi:MAG: ACP S-malonyltransferase [Planctomycetota bacterium]|nr:ACP S-malonyltransferase [Planctomycetota bacterium]